MDTNKLSVSIISNIFNPVGPSAPGGLEVFNYYLTKELEDRGIDTELWASGDSEKLKSLRPLINESLGYSQSQEFLSIPWNYRRLTVQEFMIYTDFIQKQKGQKLLHFSLVNFLPIYLAVKRDLPVIVTLHMPLTNLHYEALQKLLTPEELRRVHFIGISHSQVKNWPYTYKVIHNGIILKDFDFSSKSRDSFIWIGRFVKEKGCADAISAIEKTKNILEIAGAPHDKNERDYFINSIKPKIGVNIRHKGFVKSKERSQFYTAKALLFTSKWDEPFGLVMIEAMACGTPVIAFNRGSVSEIIKDGVTGFICPPDDLNCMIEKVKEIYQMPDEKYQKMRLACRKAVEENFTISKMVDGYEKVYRKIINERGGK